MCTTPCSSWPTVHAMSSSSGRGAVKSNCASSERSFARSSDGITGPCSTRSAASASARVSRSSARIRVVREGKSAAGGAGRSSRSLMASSERTDGGTERLVEIGDDVIDVLDADAQAYGLRPDACDALLLGRHLPVRGRGRMAGERLGVAEVHQALEELERVVEARARVVAAADGEGEQRAGATAEILPVELVVGTVGKAGVAHRGDAGVGAQEFGDTARVLHVPLDPQRHRLDALQQQERVEG